MQEGHASRAVTPVLAQLEAFLNKPAHPSALRQKFSASGLQARIDSLLRASKPSGITTLVKARYTALRRADLPHSTAFAAMIFGGHQSSEHSRTQSSKATLGPKRPSGRHRPRSGKHSEKVLEPKDVANVSRTGRTVKMPSKFKEQPRSRPQLSPTRKRAVSDARPTPKSARSEGRRSGSRAGDDDDADEDAAFTPVSESRIGADFQAALGAEPAPSTCHERGDELLWQPDGPEAEISGSALTAYLDEALPLVGGAPQHPPTPASAQREFASELVLMALHSCRGDTAAALDALRKKRSLNTVWTKVEERQFRAALAKSKGDDVLAISDAMRTKDLAAVVRLFYVEDAQRRKAEREKQREPAPRAHEQ